MVVDALPLRNQLQKTASYFSMATSLARLKD